LFAIAHNSQLEEKVMAFEQNQEDQQAEYTWQETETISIRGNVKDTKVYEIQMVNGQQQKTEISDQKAQQGGREGRVKEHVIEKKKERSMVSRSGRSRSSTQRLTPSY
jgi:hypothetical protein